MVLGVFRVGVYLGRGDEDEPCLGRQLFDERLLDIAVGGGRILILVGLKLVWDGARGVF